MHYALIENNVVKDLFVETEGVCINECFVSSVVSLYVQCPNNIAVGDFYDQETQEFTESPDRKYPNYLEWYNSMRKKNEELSYYSNNLIPIINGLKMDIKMIASYKMLLESEDNILKINDYEFSKEDFQLMFNSFEEFINKKQLCEDNHANEISKTNNVSDIDLYDFTIGWP